MVGTNVCAIPVKSFSYSEWIFAANIPQSRDAGKPVLEEYSSKKNELEETDDELEETDDELEETDDDELEGCVQSD